LAEKTTIFSLFASQPCELTKKFFFRAFSEPSESASSNSSNHKNCKRCFVEGRNCGLQPAEDIINNVDDVINKNWVLKKLGLK